MDIEKAELVEKVEALRQRLQALEGQDTARELAVSEARYRALVEGSTDFIYVLDQHGNFTFANTEIGHLLGYSPEEIIGRHYSQILHPDDVEALGRAFHERRTGQRATRRVEVRLQSRGGVTREVEMDIRHFAISASGLYRDGDFVGTHGVARDITERKYQETRRSVLQNVRDVVWSMLGVEDITQVLEAIRRAVETMGVRFQHCAVNAVDMSDPPMLSCYSSYGSTGIARLGEWMIDANQYAARVAEIWRSEKLDYRRDLERSDSRGERDQLVELFGPLRCIVDVPFSHGTFSVHSRAPHAFSDRDIGFFGELAEALSEGFRRREDLQQLALSEGRYRTLVETPNFVVMLLDVEGNYLYVSPQIEEWLGYSPEEFYRDRDIRQHIIHPDDFGAAETFHHVGRSSAVHAVEYRWRHRDGQYHWASGAIFPIYEETEDRQVNRVSMLQVVVQDITERKQAEEQIRTSLAEKEVLLKEIHHRVKNNLQIISSLLHLQATKLQDEELLRAFEDSQYRIRSMALIHEELYQSEDLARLDFAAYVRHLAEHLLESFGVNEDRVHLSIDVNGAQLTIDRAIPMGLIISELVSNSLKHAFPGDRKGLITVDLRTDREGPFCLTVGDDGVGFPDDIDYLTTDSLGLRLVNTLVGQLRAKLQLADTPGTTFTVTVE